MLCCVFTVRCRLRVVMMRHITLRQHVHKRLDLRKKYNRTINTCVCVIVAIFGSSYDCNSLV